MTKSAFIVRVPEAEPYVASLRERFDPSAAQGVPAHITLLYPFMSPEHITEVVVEKVRRIASETSPFTFHLAKIARFPSVLYLAPEPVVPLVSLSAKLASQFPDFPPYGGEYTSFVPHLTVAQGSESEQNLAASELGASLEGQIIVSSCRELVLIENSSGRWEQMHAFALFAKSNADG